MPSVDDELEHLLFGDPNCKLVNLKITRGTDEHISVGDMKREIVAALKRRDQNASSGGPPVCKKPPVDVRELIAGL